MGVIPGLDMPLEEAMQTQRAIRRLKPDPVDDALLRVGAPDEGYDPRLSRVVESAEWALFGPQDYVVVARRGAGGV